MYPMGVASFKISRAEIDAGRVVMETSPECARAALVEQLISQFALLHVITKRLKKGLKIKMHI